jgi:hypothetical protein
MSENRIRKTDSVQTHGPASAGIWATVAGLLKFNPAGTVKTIVDTDTAQTLTNKTFVEPVGTAVTADGALGVPTTSQIRYVTKAGVAAMTLAAPTSAEEGIELEVKSTTTNAHTITATGLLETGSSAVNVATFAAYAGAGVRLRAKNLKWQVVYSVGITFS